jgi:hypothetical protein
MAKQYGSVVGANGVLVIPEQIVQRCHIIGHQGRFVTPEGLHESAIGVINRRDRGFDPGTHEHRVHRECFAQVTDPFDI